MIKKNEKKRKKIPTKGIPFTDDLSEEVIFTIKLCSYIAQNPEISFIGSLFKSLPSSMKVPSLTIMQKHIITVLLLQSGLLVAIDNPNEEDIRLYPSNSSTLRKNSHDL